MKEMTMCRIIASSNGDDFPQEALGINTQPRGQVWDLYSTLASAANGVKSSLRLRARHKTNSDLDETDLLVTS